jgi:C-methyltransferase C-terminal domain/Putative zinc binding domain/Methyltransferase domain
MSTSAPVCRSCGAGGLELILSLGRSPLANALLSAEQLDRPEPAYPLELAFCPHCTLVQILETVPPEQLFRDYLYFSSFSDTMVEHAAGLVRELIARHGLNGDSLVIEAASNDGYLLRHYRAAGIPVLGIEPAVQAAEVAHTRHGIDTCAEFFTEELARRLRDEGRRPRVFHAHNVLAHVADLNGFSAGMALLLAGGGVGIVEVPYVKDLVDRCEFDTIYHEHLCYFSLTALCRLFGRHGLVVQDAERIAIHGGSLRLTVVPAGGEDPSARTDDLLRQEAEWGLDRLDFYLGLARRVAAAKAALCGLLGDLKRRGNRLAAYGASAKGSVLLNYCGIGRDLLEFVVDRSTVKQGRYMPGVRLPIHAPARLLEAMPDYVLLLTWNFAEEILRQQGEYRRRGGRFILPVPEARVA